MKNFIFLLLFSNTIIAQVRFNKSYLYQQNKIEATSTLELPDGYLISERIVLSNDSAIGIGIRKIDLFGNNIWYKKLSHPGTQIIASKNAMHFGLNNTIWISCTYSDSLLTLIPSDGMLINININGDSLFSVKFGGPQSDRIYNSIVDNDGNIVCAGAKYKAANKDNPWAIKFDQNGNLLWENQQNNSSFSRHFEALLQNDNGDYFFAGIIKQSGENILRSKINNDGTTAWTKPNSISNFLVGRATGIATFEDELIITGNNNSGSENTISYNFYDTAGNYLDYRQFGHVFLKLNLYTNPLLIDSNSFAVAGRNQNHEGDSAYWGWFINFQYPDSMIWDRTYHYNNSSDHLFYDLKRTSDGGFIICGFNKNDSLNVNNSWVVKLDSNGCDVPGCELLNTNDIQNKELKISISPNPANQFFDINFNGRHGKVIVQLFSIEGVQLSEWKIDNNERFSLDKYANGLYMIRIFENNYPQRFEHLKLIINK